MSAITGDNDEQAENEITGRAQGIPDGTRFVDPDGKKQVHNNEQNEAVKADLAKQGTMSEQPTSDTPHGSASGPNWTLETFERIARETPSDLATMAVMCARSLAAAKAELRDNEILYGPVIPEILNLMKTGKLTQVGALEAMLAERTADCEVLRAENAELRKRPTMEQVKAWLGQLTFVTEQDVCELQANLADFIEEKRRS